MISSVLPYFYYSRTEYYIQALNADYLRYVLLCIFRLHAHFFKIMFYRL